MGRKVTKEEAEKGRECALCGRKLEEGDKVSGGRGKTLLGPEWAGLMVIVHDSCLDEHDRA